MGESSSTRRAPSSALLLVAVLALVIGLMALSLMTWPRAAEQAGGSPMPSVVVGIPGGAIIPEPTPRPTGSAAPVPTGAPIEATPEQTVGSTPQPTHEAPPAPTLQPAAAATLPPPTPQPTAAVVALAGPADAVAAFYANVASGAFDDAYALWSDRMRATYPRETNLDSRFDETAGITFHQLAVVEQGPTSATVQANFTETADDGSSREFIGFWRLVQVNGRWLLDEPHY